MQWNQKEIEKNAKIFKIPGCGIEGLAFTQLLVSNLKIVFNFMRGGGGMKKTVLKKLVTNFLIETENFKIKK